MTTEDLRERGYRGASGLIFWTPRVIKGTPRIGAAVFEAADFGVDSLCPVLTNRNGQQGGRVVAQGGAVLSRNSVVPECSSLGGRRQKLSVMIGLNIFETFSELSSK